MNGIVVNPAAVLKGDSIAIQHRTVTDKKTGKQTIVVSKSRKINYVGFCETQPECIHLDNECYDTRYSTVVKTV